MHLNNNTEITKFCKVIILQQQKNKLKKKSVRLPWWLSGKESACHCRRHRFDPLSGKIPHAMGQLSPCTVTIEPVL